MASAESIQRAGEVLATAAGSSAQVILFGSHARDEARAARRGKVPGTMVYHALRDGKLITQP